MITESADPRVIVDATAVPADRGGVGRYVDGLLGSITGDILIACQDRDHDYYCELAPDATVLPQRGISNTPARLLWEQVRLPILAKRHRALVIFSPHYTLPLFSRRRRVVTFHDATFFSDPNVHTRMKRAFFRSWIRISARLADRVIVPSHATAIEVERYVTRDRGYVVAFHGVDTTFFHPPTTKAISELAAELSFDGAPWIAFLGTIEPRKNVPALVRAYRGIVDVWQPEWGRLPLLALAGGSGWETELDTELAAVRMPGVARRVGFLPLDRLAAFLGGAVVVCYPSLGEGFGLPVLEAMASGAPVLTTRRLAIPEVGDDAVAYTDISSESISDGLLMLLKDSAERVRLRELGLLRSREFTWRRSAETHEGVFRALGEESRRGADR
jgi:glycosyltransferase involved in cell wall biosynthesis